MQAVAKLQRIENEKLLGKKPLVKNVPQEPTICTFQNCHKENAVDQLPELTCTQELNEQWGKLLSESEWTKTDRTMFNCLYDSFEDYCIVASLLNNKTCVEVRIIQDMTLNFESLTFIITF